MPVMRVMKSNTVESASPPLKAASQVEGIQVSMETQKSARRTHQAVRIIRSICGALEAAAVGGGGGSTVERGSRLRSSVRMPRRINRAATRTKNGRAGSTAEKRMLDVGREARSVVLTTPIS